MCLQGTANLTELLSYLSMHSFSDTTPFLASPLSCLPSASSPVGVEKLTDTEAPGESAEESQTTGPSRKKKTSVTPLMNALPSKCSDS